jgi:DNA-binding CsgD family transcriptional regulator
VADVQARTAFHNAFRQIRVTDDREPIKIAPIVITRRSKPPIVATIFSVPVAVRSPFSGARTIVVLTDTGSDLSPNREMLSQMFMLTPAEIRIAVLIAKGLAPEAVAEKLKVSDETVRNQLKAVLRKTDTHRQAELVALLARLPSSQQ